MNDLYMGDLTDMIKSNHNIETKNEIIVPEITTDIVPNDYIPNDEIIYFVNENNDIVI